MPSNDSEDDPEDMWEHNNGQVEPHLLQLLMMEKTAESSGILKEKGPRNHACVRGTERIRRGPGLASREGSCPSGHEDFTVPTI